jgi:hydroxyacylglutathione hydrolase
MFLFIGSDKALLVDTGATEAEDRFPLFQVVDSLIQLSSSKSLPLVVAHSHSHSDHHAGDGQFAGQPNVEVVGLSVNEVKTFFRIENWPEDNSSFDLGGRTLDIIPIPGHEKSSLAFYDRNTRLLLTGDTFYPGRLYIEDWVPYKKSIAKLMQFSAGHKVSHILGNHIEMSNAAGIDYPTGTTFQPDEIMLPLKTEDLNLLFKALEKLGDNHARDAHAKFIIYPK